MFVEVSADGVALHEPDDVTRLHVVADAGLDDTALDTALRGYGVGYLESHAAFVGSSWLRNHGEPSAQWEAKLDGMLAYAATKGWIRDGYVQAHVERGQNCSTEDASTT